MTRDELIALVESYAKGTDAPILTQQLPIAESRIGRDLRVPENEAIADLLPADSSIVDVPADYGSPRAVQASGNRGWYSLESVELGDLVYYQASGDPLVYTVRELQIEVRPYAGQPLRLQYYARPSLPNPDSTNAVLTRFPQLYLYAVQAEVSLWERDREGWLAMQQAFRAELDRTNTVGNRARAGKPAARRG